MLRQILIGGGLAASLVLAGCASPGGSIYVPASQSPDYDRAPAPPQTTESGSRVKKSEQPAETEVIDRDTAPRHQEQGESLSPAAASLMREASSLLAQGDPRGAVSKLERAQRISPRSAEIYYKLSEAYVALDQLGAAEQFTLKGLSLAGSNTGLQRAGWMLLADIRRATGNTAGADHAEARADAL
ncbi:tetratricopeptide repeat protein [Marinobacter caseinilyticus]|uniref:tetratricopeptide repeat protein n=1 Tax=Marinobacter caseinilyticus TaxID=2692195 RepID=UPI00140C88DC|nr:tetratricopeptide repeat protein [Marinobacter caseinilyticus]